MGRSDSKGTERVQCTSMVRIHDTSVHRPLVKVKMKVTFTKSSRFLKVSAKKYSESESERESQALKTELSLSAISQQNSYLFHAFLHMKNIISFT